MKRFDTRKVLGSIIGIIAFVAVVVAVTFAMYVWRGTDTNVTFNINDEYFYCQSGIENEVESLSPVLDYKEGTYQKFTVNNLSSSASTFSITLNISQIDSSLISESLKYQLVVDETGGNNDCTTSSSCTGTSVTGWSGDFSNAKIGANTLVQNVIIPSGGKYEYYLFIYIDGNMQNDPTMQSATMTSVLDVCEVVVFLNYGYNCGDNLNETLKLTESEKYVGLTDATRANTVITYNSNGGSSISSETISYTFGGWYKENTFVNKVTSASTMSSTVNHTLYAKWTPSKSITLPTPTRTGYTFDGWYSDSGLTNKVGNAGATYNPDCTTTLYAKWIENKATITIKKNGSNWSASGMKISLSTSNTSDTNSFSTTVSSGTTATLTKIAAGTKYYIWAGKNDSNKTTTAYTGVEITGATTISGTVNYYTLVLNEGPGISTVSGSGVYLSSQTANINATASTGYTFSEWTVDSGNIPTSTSTANTTVSTSQATTLIATATATFEADRYKITLNANSCGSIASGTNPFYAQYGTANSYTTATGTTAATAPTFTVNAGYTFNGWYSATSGGSKVLTTAGALTGTAVSGYTTASTWATTEDKTLYAQCSVNTYTIAYTCNGGTCSGPTSGTYNTDVQISNPTGKTYTLTLDANGTGATLGATSVESGNATFSGWTSSSSAGLGSNAKTGTAANPSTAWTGSSTKNTYFRNLRDTSGTVTLTANWGSATATLPTVSKQGYLCSWNNAANGSGYDYNSGASGFTMSSDTTLYAKCNKILTATFNYNGGTETRTCTLTGTNTSCSVTAPGALGTPSGYTFRGWSTDTAGDATISIAASGTASISADTNYYASYSKSKSTTFYYNSNTTCESLTIATKSVSGTAYKNYEGTDSYSDISIPSEVSGSKGQYNNTYIGVQADTDTTPPGSMSSVTTSVSLQYSYYWAVYRSSVSVYRPTSTTAAGKITRYRNSYFTSTSEMTTVLAGSTTGTSNITSVSGILGTLSGFATSVNSTTIAHSTIDNLAKSCDTTVYAVSTTSINATFYYNSNNTAGSLTVATKTASGNRTNYCSSTSAATTKAGSITVPSEVSSSKGKYNSAYKAVASSLDSMTAATPTTATTTYYAVYSSKVTIYRPSSTTACAATTTQVYRNEWFDTTSATSQTLSASQTSTTAITTVAGITGTFSGLATAVNSTTIKTVAERAASSTTTFYAVALSSNTITITTDMNGYKDSTGLQMADTSVDGKMTIYCKTKSTATAGLKYTVTPPPTTNANSYFINWNSKADGTGTVYTAGSTYTFTASTTIYAYWTPTVVSSTDGTNTVYFTSINDAVEYSWTSSSYSNITLLIDHSENADLNTPDGLNLDLNSKTLTGSIEASGGGRVSIDGNGTVQTASGDISPIIVEGSTELTILSGNYITSSAVATIANNGETLNITGGTYSNSNSSSLARVIHNSTSGTVNITGGTYTLTGSTAGTAIYGDGNINIKNATINSSAYGVGLADSGEKMIIVDSSITTTGSQYGIIINGGVVEMHGGTLSGTKSIANQNGEIYLWEIPHTQLRNNTGRIHSVWHSTSDSDIVGLGVTNGTVTHCPTWTDDGDQSDINWYTASSMTVGGQTMYYCRFNRTNHDSTTGPWITHFYNNTTAYSGSGVWYWDFSKNY